MIFSVATKVSTQCSNRLYIFERIPSYKFEGTDDKEIQTTNRTECEDKCLNEHSFVCRSITFNRKTSKCKMSKETRYTNPKGFKVDPNCDYMENMCLPSMTTKHIFLMNNFDSNLSFKLLNRDSDVRLECIHFRNW